MFKSIWEWFFPVEEYSTFVGDNKENLTRLATKLDGTYNERMTEFGEYNPIACHLNEDDDEISGEDLIGDDWMKKDL